MRARRSKCDNNYVQMVLRWDAIRWIAGECNLWFLEKYSHLCDSIVMPNMTDKCVRFVIGCRKVPIEVIETAIEIINPHVAELIR